MKVLIILVLYRMRLADSSSYTTLMRSVDEDAKRYVDLLVIDNSPTADSMWNVIHSLPCTYYHDPHNGGLASAYNAGLAHAQSAGANWLLLLDQDSTLSEEFLATTLRAIKTCDKDDRVAAVVPKVVGHVSTISPKVVRLGYLTNLPSEAGGICMYEITAINSGVALKTAFVIQIGGFSTQYWLDFLDYWVFRSVYKNGKVAFFSQARLLHNLSVETRDLSSSRYFNILKAESTFIRQECAPIVAFVYVFRLFGRLVKNAVDRRFEFARLDGRFLCRLLSGMFRSRSVQ